MQFEPRLPREGINVSKTHPLKEAATLMAGLAAVFAALVLFIAWSVDLAIGLISPEAEAEAFESLGLDPVLRAATAGNDERREKIERLLDKLVVHWPDAPYDFRVAIWDSDEANAAALPGGLILVTRTLLDEVGSENELAFVLGHELGHFHGRDHLRRLGRGMVYGLALSVISGFGAPVPELPTLAGELTARGFDREQEREADRFGLTLIHAEYGHIGSSWHFFQRLAAEHQGLENMIAYLSTHPAGAERVELLQDFARTRGWSLDGPADAF